MLSLMKETYGLFGKSDRFEIDLFQMELLEIDVFRNRPLGKTYLCLIQLDVFGKSRLVNMKVISYYKGRYKKNISYYKGICYFYKKKVLSHFFQLPSDHGKIRTG